MNRRIPLTIGAAAGGVLAAALLPAAIAFADTGSAAAAAADAAAAVAPSATGADAFTANGFTFDPFFLNPQTFGLEEGFNTSTPQYSVPPFLEVGSSTPQEFEVYSGSGSGAEQLGAVVTNDQVTQLLGMTNTEFTIGGIDPATGVQSSALPATGSVYDVFNLGNGYANVYVDVPGASGGANTITDYLATPFGHVNLDSLFGNIDVLSALDPGNAFTGLAGAADPLAFLGL